MIHAYSLLILICSILTISLLDRCKLYNINTSHCQNSVYVPSSSYDQYLASFNLPIQKDAECSYRNCIIVVYKDPARIAVNPTPDRTKQVCDLSNANDCFKPTPSTTSQQQITTQPAIIVTKSVFLTSNPEQEIMTTKRSKHTNTDDSEESESESKKRRKKTVTKTVTETTSIKNTSENKKSKSDTDENNKTDCSESSISKTSEVPKTVTIHDNKDCTDCHETTTSEKEKKTVTVKNEKPATENNNNTVTVTLGNENNSTNNVASTVTVSVPVNSVPPIVSTNQIQPTTSLPINTSTNTPQSITNTSEISNISKTIDAMKSIIKEEICGTSSVLINGKCTDTSKKTNNEKESNLDESMCDDDSVSDKKDSKKKRKKKRNTKEYESTSSDSEDDSKTKKKSKKTSEEGPVITLTRVETRTVTDEVPITLYREIIKTIDHDKIITKFKVTTETKTITISDKSTVTQTFTASPTISMTKTEDEPPIQTLSIPSKVSFSEFSNTPKFTQISQYIPNEIPLPLEKSDLIQRPLTQYVRIPDRTKINTLPDLQIKNEPIKNIPSENEENDLIAKNLMPLFGKFLDNLSVESFKKKSNDKEPEKPISLEKPEISTVCVTKTQFVTHTVPYKKTQNVCIQNSENDCNENQKTVINTVYKKAPMRMKCSPAKNRKVNCVMIKEGTVYKTVFDKKTEA